MFLSYRDYSWHFYCSVACKPHHKLHSLHEMENFLSDLASDFQLWIASWNWIVLGPVEILKGPFFCPFFGPDGTVKLKLSVNFLFKCLMSLTTRLQRLRKATMMMFQRRSAATLSINNSVRAWLVFLFKVRQLHHWVLSPYNLNRFKRCKSLYRDKNFKSLVNP